MRESRTYPDLGSTGGGVVVVVHDDVDGQVEGDDDPLLLGQLVPFLPERPAAVIDFMDDQQAFQADRSLTTEVSPSS